MKRLLTTDEIEKIYKLTRTSTLSLAGIERVCEFRDALLREAVRSKTKMSEDQIHSVFATLKTSQKIQADDGIRFLCPRCKNHLTRAGASLCDSCEEKGTGQNSEAERLNLHFFRKETLERFAQAENASVANANFAESIHDRVKRLEQVKSDPKLRPSELASRIEHCMQELSRQGRALTEARNEIEDRITALAQALADREKECDEDASEELKRVRDEVKQALVKSQLVDPDVELLKSFAGFERVCRQMRDKCPHLFAATVRRSVVVE